MGRLIRKIKATMDKFRQPRYYRRLARSKWIEQRVIIYVTRLVQKRDVSENSQKKGKPT